jgi:large subunit ribosomal protein L28
MFGNNVSFSENKTRRKFNPNVQRKRLWSVVLQSWLKFSVTTRALKCIDKCGGIDEYLMETKDVKLQSVAGQNAKRMIQHRLDQEQKWKDALGV